MTHSACKKNVSLSATLAGTDVDVETLTYGISGGTVAAVVSTLFFFNDTATTEIYTLSLHDALPISTIEALDDGENHSDVFTVTVSDGDGPAVTQTYTVNVSGADDGRAHG